MNNLPRPCPHAQQARNVSVQLPAEQFTKMALQIYFGWPIKIYYALNYMPVEASLCIQSRNTVSSLLTMALVVHVYVCTRVYVLGISSSVICGRSTPQGHTIRSRAQPRRLTYGHGST